MINNFEVRSLKVIGSGCTGRAQAETTHPCLSFETITPLSNRELPTTARARDNKDPDRGIDAFIFFE